MIPLMVTLTLGLLIIIVHISGSQDDNFVHYIRHCNRIDTSSPEISTLERHFVSLLWITPPALSGSVYASFIGLQLSPVGLFCINGTIL